jgi:intracellular multiplication protein IcmQ
MDNRKTDEELKILDALEEAIKNGPWEASTFLRVIGKKLQEIRDNFIDATHEKSTSSSTNISQAMFRSGQKEIFISLYSQGGSSISAWEKIISSLPNQVLSRPIYADEKSASNSIRMKENKVNEAYVSFFILPSDILNLSPDKTPKDKLGRSLLTLKDRTLKLENFNKFIHETGVYKYFNGRLVKVANLETD